MSKPSHHRLSSFPVLRSLLDECRTEHELRSLCTRISPLLTSQADRQLLVTYFHHLMGRGIGEQGEQTILKRAAAKATARAVKATMRARARARAMATMRARARAKPELDEFEEL